MSLHVPPFIDNDISSSNRVTAAWLNAIQDEVYKANSGTSTAVNRAVAEIFADVYNAKNRGAIGDGVTDDTAALAAGWAAAISAGKAFFVPDGNYLVTSTPFTITYAQQKACLFGMPNLSIIRNRAPVNNPSILLFGAQYFYIGGLVLAGYAGYPNEGIKAQADGSGNRVGAATIENLVCVNNGVGIHLTDANSISINNYMYFPSGNTWNVTVDAANQTNAILADGTSSVNAIYVTGGNVAANVQNIAGGGAAIKWNTTTVSNNIRISNTVMEASGAATYRSIDFANVYSFELDGDYAENTSFRFLNCRGGTVNVHGGQTLNITCGDGTAPNACVGISFDTITGLTFVADSNNSGIDHYNTVWTTYTNSAINSVSFAVTDGSTGHLPDRFAYVGYRERGRTYNAGEFQTPTFAAGDFTAQAGNWTLTSGDVATSSWAVVGYEMTWEFQFNLTTVSATPDNLRALIPGGFAAKNTLGSPILYYSEDGGTTWAVGVLYTFAGDSKLYFYKDLNGSTWQTKTNLTNVQGRLTFAVQ